MKSFIQIKSPFAFVHFLRIIDYRNYFKHIGKLHFLQLSTYKLKVLIKDKNRLIPILSCATTRKGNEVFLLH